MKISILKKRCIYIIVILSIIGLVIYNMQNKDNKIIMGGTNLIDECEESEKNVINKEDDIDVEKYFRPSKLPILNTEKYSLEILTKDISNTPENTIINYYSILREAANPGDKINTGCGTLGYAKDPYPISYKFLSQSYQNKLSYDEYLKSFKNILHINLIKLKEVKIDESHPNSLKYFIELETIEGSEKPMGYFGYYYGFIYVDKINGEYKISDIQYHGENYLCTPYHGWEHDARSFVEIQYGGWCSLIKGYLRIEEDGYIKNVYFSGTDGNEYMVQFFILTNGDDIKIADFKKDKNNKWVEINIDTKKCLQKK